MIVGAEPSTPEAKPDRTSDVRALLFKASAQLEAQVKSAVSSAGISTPQANALRGLDRPMTQRELAAAMSCDPSTITYVLDQLESRQLVVRTPHPTDRRAKLVTLTGAGTSTRAELIDRFEAAAPLASLDDGDLESLRGLLARIVSGDPSQGAA